MSAEHEPDRTAIEALAARVAAADSWPRRRETRLVRRVLARTTREDPGWRGDLRLVLAHAREHLRSSRALRLVAASLLAHLLVLPVFAWLAHREAAGEPGFRTGIEPRTALPFQREETSTTDLREPLPWEAVESLDADGSAPRAAADNVENVLRRDRFVLQRHALPLGPRPSADAALEIRLLEARSRGAKEGRWETWIDDQRALARAQPLARMLWLELLLDRHALEGTRSPLLPAALARLSETIARGGAMGAFATRVLDRARAYGSWEVPAGFDPLAVDAPGEASWLADRARAWDEAGAASLPEAWRPVR